jgi:hypothetical protein
VSSPNAISSAELALAAALSRHSRVKGTLAEPQARKAVDAARRAVAAAQAATTALAERTCCGMPMTWCVDKWICTYGHD